MNITHCENSQEDVVVRGASPQVPTARQSNNAYDNANQGYVEKSWCWLHKLLDITAQCEYSHHAKGNNQLSHKDHVHFPGKQIIKMYYCHHQWCIKYFINKSWLSNIHWHYEINSPSALQITAKHTIRQKGKLKKEKY